MAEAIQNDKSAGLAHMRSPHHRLLREWTFIRTAAINHRDRNIQQPQIN